MPDLSTWWTNRGTGSNVTPGTISAGPLVTGVGGYSMQMVNTPDQQPFIDTPPQGVPTTFRCLFASMWLVANTDGSFLNAGSFSDVETYYEINSFITIVQDVSPPFWQYQCVLLQVLGEAGDLLDAAPAFSFTPGQLYNVIVSLDAVANTLQVYINGDAVPLDGLDPGGNPEVTWLGSGLITNPVPGTFWGAAFGPGAVGDAFVYISDSFVDIPSNLSKFYQGGMPVFLGDDGSVPFGVQPTVFLSVTSSTPPVEPEVDMADLWFGPTSGFFDLSVAANRRRFIDPSGCPLFLGAGGQLPDGQAPPVFLTSTGGTAASFAGNNGLGGAFNNGTDLSLSSDSPCCSEHVVAAFNAPQGADPQVILSVSDDGGRTWGLVRKARSMGEIGQYLKRIRWMKMGQFRQRVIRLEITDPVKRAFVGFYVDLEAGMKGLE